MTLTHKTCSTFEEVHRFIKLNIFVDIVKTNEDNFEQFFYCTIPQEIQGAQFCHSSSTFQS